MNEEKVIAKRIRQKRYAKLNKEKVAAYQKIYYSKNKDKLLARRKALRERPGILEKERQRVKEWGEKNPDKLLAKRKRERQNPSAKTRFTDALRRRIRSALNGTTKSAKSMELLGCSWEEARSHIESLWKPGMSWENRREWHLDHIIPCCAFDLTKEEEQKKCFNIKNLQPLWKHENMSKGGDTINDGFGNVWSKWCDNCKKKTMQVVRPGKAACALCN
jgi:hypothetical protein